MAVHLDRTGAVAVAEHAAVHLGAQPAHLLPLVGGGELARLLIEDLDLLGDLEVLVRDGLVGNPGRNSELISNTKSIIQGFSLYVRSMTAARSDPF